jgi:fructose-bisphosphate aldolase class II
LIRAADEVYPEAIFAVHLDHGDEETCYDCIAFGFYSSVMIDASSKPYEETLPSPSAWWTRRMPKALWWKRNWGSWAAWKSMSRSDEANAKLTTSAGARFCGAHRLRFSRRRDWHQHGAFKFSGTQSLHFDVLARIQQNCRASRW